MTKITPHYPMVDANPNFAALEEEILIFWRENGVFERSVDQRHAVNADGSNNAYVFYDGPPFANGLPHYGHLLTGYVKDAIARYHTMKGRRVERRFGWDCHGLPAEMGAEKELGISGRAAIAAYGIGKFNAHCRESVMKYTKEWEYYVTRQGRWVDFKNDYKTMDRDFMESVIWAFSELYKKGLIYESMRVMPYSWAAETPVSNFETRLDNATREREDLSAYVTFTTKSIPADVSEVLKQIYKGDYPFKTLHLIAWTTTPWTLPSNLALAVNTKMQYRYMHKGDQLYLAGKSFVENTKWLKEQGFEIDFPAYHDPYGGTASATLYATSGDLLGINYEPLFPYFAGTTNAFRVLDGSAFVTDGDGTGIVHMAPGFGEVDQVCANENGIETLVPVDEKGRFTDAIYDLPDLQLKGHVVVPDTRYAESEIHVPAEDAAQHITPKDVARFGLANMRIVRWLKAHGALVKAEPFKHNYPHCWRTDTPLIYRAMASWYVDVPKIKGKMAENNRTINWIPGHVRDGQMGHMIDTAPGWSISRNRFWGTPIPIWKSPSGKLIVPGSIAEMEELSGKKIADLHRPFIDDITFTKDGEEYTRIEDVFDCWFESGSMPYAQLHYPFENKARFEREFPADFITEYIAQTRGWFNTLITLSAALFEQAPFKNVICHGVVIDEETGLKYSKRLKNYKDPKEVMDQFGADALRWLMLASPVMRGADLAVDPEGKFIRDVVRLNIKPLWSAYNFFTLYANADGVQAKQITVSENLLDRYILAKCKAAVSQVQTSMDAYDTPGATEAITGFFEVLNNWYIRRSRARFWGEELSADKQAAYDTLFTVLNLMCIAAAPLLPFTVEAIYRGLNGNDQSVHLVDFPNVRAMDSAVELIADMDRVRDACTAMGAIRSAENIRNRQPLASATLYGAGASRLKPFSGLMEDEINVKEIRFADTLEGVAEYTLTIDFKVAGKRLGGKMKAVGAAAKAGDWKREGDQVIVGGEPVEPGEYNLQLKSLIAKGAQALSGNDALVVLDLNLTPELEAEGRARDLVREIQQLRKDSGLDVSDRIHLTVDDSAKAWLNAELQQYVKEQTLSIELSFKAGVQGAANVTAGAETPPIAIAKAA